MTHLRCPECGHQLHGLERLMVGLRAEVEAERQRKAQHAAYRRFRYATDPDYRARQVERTQRWRDNRKASSTSSTATDTTAAALSSTRSRSRRAA